MFKISNYYLLLVTLIIVGLTSCQPLDNSDDKDNASLADTWQIFSSDSVNDGGDVISSNNYKLKYLVNAKVPTTVFNALVEGGIYKDVFLGKNLNNIDVEKFKKPWWYRNVFNIDNINSNFELSFEGINYKANIWLNGKQIADTSDVNNAFRMYSFKVDGFIKEGENILAVEVFPPKAGDFSIGFVDWNPAPPDQNMGIFRDVKLTAINKVQVVQPYIETYFKNDNYTVAFENASCLLKNYTDKKISGIVELNINDKVLHKSVKLDANESILVSFVATEDQELVVENPQLWWPYTIGEPIMHNASFSFIENNATLSSVETKYGIREIKDYYNDEGHRGFIINGEKILIRGAGWVDNMMLNNTHDYDRAQLEYVINMNLNTIRLEGFWGKDDYLYKTCDELGILVMVGWSCHWEWEDYLGKYCDEKYGGILNDYDVNMMSQAWQDQLVWLRNHPSIFAWFGGSDCIATPDLESSYFETFNKYDSSRIYLSSAKEWETDDIKSGVKMRGPYAYEPPIYWFADTLYGGAFGFNTETGPGAQVPPIESIRKMIPKKNLWPINDVWDFHCGRNEFNNLDRFTKALNARYGESKSVEEYATKAQILNYELMRPMFEAFSANRYKATGIIQWMLNSAWPEMYWQLYDSYLMPNGAFYATKKAGEALHALYNYENNNIYLVNDRLKEENNIETHISVYDINSKIVFSEIVKNDIDANSSISILSLENLNVISNVYFIDLRVVKDKKEIANNFYWLSKKKDVLDYDFEFESWYYHTPSKQYADFTALNTMKKADVEYKLVTLKNNDDSDYTFYNVELENNSNNIAFFLELQLVEKKTGEIILPIIWSDNYVSLVPNEKREISVKVNTKYLKDNIDLRVKGYNINN